MKINLGFAHNNTDQHGGGVWDYNTPLLGAQGTVAGTLIGDLKDDTNTATGYTLTNTVAANTSEGSGTWATGGAGGWPERVFDYCWRSANGGVSTITASGLTEGDTYSVFVAGHNNTSNRHTKFTVNGVSADYLVSNDAANPTAPIEFTGTVPANGEIVISYEKADSGQFYGYLSGATLEITSGSSSASTTSDVIPPANNSFVDLTSVAAAGDRITTTPDLAIGDHVRHEAILYQGATPTGHTVVVNADGTYTLTGANNSPIPDGTYTFEARVYDNSDQTWGTAADQTVVISGGVPLPVYINGKKYLGLTLNLSL